MNKKEITSIILILVLNILLISSRHPLIEPRFLICSESPLNLENNEILSNSGCYYSWYIYKIFQPLNYIPQEHYRLITIAITIAILALNTIILKKIANKRKINTTATIILSLLLLFQNKNGLSGIDTLIEFTFINLGLLFYFNNTKKSLILSGLFLSLATIIRPMAGLLLIALIITTTKPKIKNNLKIKKKNIKKSLMLLIGGAIIPTTYLFNSQGYLKVILSSSIRAITPEIIGLRHIIYLLIYGFLITKIKKRKEPLYYAFIITMPILFIISITEGAGIRFLNYLATPAIILLLKEKKIKKTITVLIIILTISMITNIAYNASLYNIKTLFEEQLLLINKTSILTDLSAHETLRFKHTLYNLEDSWTYRKNGYIITPELSQGIKELKEKTNITIIGPFEHESIFWKVNWSSYNIILIPTIDHDCLTCRHTTAILFENKNEAINFKSSLEQFWIEHKEQLCKESPYYYNITRFALSLIRRSQEDLKPIILPDCKQEFDKAIIMDKIDSTIPHILTTITITLLLVLIISKYKKPPKIKIEIPKIKIKLK